MLLCQVWQNQSCKYLTHSAQGNWCGYLNKSDLWFVTYLPISPSAVSQTLKFLGHTRKCVLGTNLLSMWYKPRRKHSSFPQWICNWSETWRRKWKVSQEKRGMERMAFSFPFSRLHLFHSLPSSTYPMAPLHVWVPKGKQNIVFAVLLRV